MTNISVELIPRDVDSLKADLELTKKIAPTVSIINIPDLLRFDLRSYEAAGISKAYFKTVIPHIRAIDIDVSKPLPMKDILRKYDIRQILVIEGDPPQDMKHTVYPTVTTDIIAKFKQEMPEVKIYAGIDPYRRSFRRELYSIKRKINAGASGFFTQPFFDLRLLEVFHDIMPETEIYWGISPVLSTNSQNYWELKNNVIFPKGFTPSLEWSIDFARKVIEYSQKTDTSLYFMPITANIEEYLKGVLG